MTSEPTNSTQPSRQAAIPPQTSLSCRRRQGHGPAGSLFGLMSLANNAAARRKTLFSVSSRRSRAFSAGNVAIFFLWPRCWAHCSSWLSFFKTGWATGRSPPGCSGCPGAHDGRHPEELWHAGHPIRRTAFLATGLSLYAARTAFQLKIGDKHPAEFLLWP